MRIQHNIPAMNAYRNYNSNTKALQGNLQKLSSGYKINKAGDDAAGLAISEKMRAQITGLEVAQKNAKDGISLVQTAEGALTEVHTMLNRMYSLAEQSANGTYADDVDREQLQKEVVSLREEIDRIADASNFNGKKLLDGSLAGKGSSSSGSSSKITAEVVGATATAIATTAATKTKGQIATALSGATASTAGDVTAAIAYKDANGKEQTITVKLTTTDGQHFVAEDGTKYDGAAAAMSATEMSDAVAKELQKTGLGDSFTFDGNSGTLKYEAKEAGAGGPEILSFTIQNNANTTKQSTSVNLADTTNCAKGTDEFDVLDVSKLGVWDGTDVDKAADTSVTIGDKTFVIAAANTTNEQMAALADKGIIGVKLATGTTPAAADAKALATRMSEELGVIFAEPAAAPAGSGATHIQLKDVNGGTLSKSSGGLTLQIGDTSDEYNKMTVSVNDCHAAAIGVGSVDIGTQEGASAAMTSIKDAINYVSDVRGTLGALQNRLDHTINNLSVQQENIQDAEATIRDVDVANEMMAYTKNNILVQSAQAMLAQANQLPQGVLQLLG